MTPSIGVAIITYQSPDDAKACVDSVIDHSPEETPILVWDNSQDARTLTALRDYGQIEYVRSPGNVGCCCSRNHIVEWVIRKGLSHVCVLDQDVTATADGWLADLLAPFEQYPDTGITSYECIPKQLMTGGFDCDETGVTPQVPGACCMISVACVRAVNGWAREFMFYRGEDSDFCLRAGLAGFRTRLVRGVQKTAHPTHSSGMSKNPRCAAIQAVSEAIFQQRARAINFPKIPGVTC